MATNKKISQFTGQTSVADDALFTLVSAYGDNIKISVADFRFFSLNTNHRNCSG